MFRLTLLFLLMPFFVYAYSSVISEPQTAFDIIPVLDPTTNQEFYGALKGFPHTYEFVVTNPLNFKAQVSVFDTKSQKNDVSIILVKEVSRGVTEIDRTHKKEFSWESFSDGVIAERFRVGGSIGSEIEPGIYRLEVSSPSNDGTYRLMLGNEKPSYGYFENIQRVYEVRQFLGKSPITILFSRLLYIPIFILLLLFVGRKLYKKKYA